MKVIAVVFLVALLIDARFGVAEGIEIREDDDKITISTPQLDAVIRKRGYVSGVAGGTFVDKKTGFRDAGFGLDIVDWIMEPGSDAEYRDKLTDDMKYRTGNLYHGKQAKRSIEGPQICTQAKHVTPRVMRGKDFVAVQMSFKYKTAAPGKMKGSTWTQTIVFPKGKRYFISSDRIDAVNSSDGMFLRIDLPGHIKHKRGDTFSKIYLSYLPVVDPPPGFDGHIIPSGEFFKDFAPDKGFNYRRDRTDEIPHRFIRAYRLRDRESGKQGPWLAGMTLDPSVVHEAWCHQRGYVCMIEEFGGRPIKAGGSFSAAFVVGFFDSIEEMHEVYDRFKGHNGLIANEREWKLTR